MGVEEPVIFMAAMVLIASSSTTCASEACAYSASSAWEVGRAVTNQISISTARTTKVIIKTWLDCWAIKMRITIIVPMLITNSVRLVDKKLRSVFTLERR